VKLARVELELVDPAKNARRFYAMTVRFVTPRARQLPLFLHVDLVTERARLEWKDHPVVRVERFLDLERLRARWNALLAMRRRHGYVVTSDTAT